MSLEDYFFLLVGEQYEKEAVKMSERICHNMNSKASFEINQESRQTDALFSLVVTPKECN